MAPIIEFYKDNTMTNMLMIKFGIIIIVQWEPFTMHITICLGESRRCYRGSLLICTIYVLADMIGTKCCLQKIYILTAFANASHALQPLKVPESRMLEADVKSRDTLFYRKAIMKLAGVYLRLKWCREFRKMPRLGKTSTKENLSTLSSKRNYDALNDLLAQWGNKMLQMLGSATSRVGFKLSVTDATVASEGKQRTLFSNFEFLACP
ncbi:hypothetical protein MTR_1g028010 [Medicago truncatula]|uniref:Uncharacterized protein n=1 Tax=Medicago truncatula TaxID=3880 RepID=A0A072VQJ1_MEDTR|nr:hypothetical protein MTR_1g028010 [Medicago truncatula]